MKLLVWDSGERADDFGRNGDHPAVRLVSSFDPLTKRGERLFTVNGAHQ